MVERRRVVYTRRATEDAKKLAAAGLKPKAQYLLEVLAQDPYRMQPPFEKLVGAVTTAVAPRRVCRYIEGRCCAAMLRNTSFPFGPMKRVRRAPGINNER